MVNGISNIGFQGTGNIGTTTNARPYMQMPYENTAATDTIEIADKKKSKTGKTIAVVLGTALVAAAALFGFHKAGKLKTFENPTKITEKLQNWAAKGGAKIAQGVDWVTNKSKSLITSIKEKFVKKATPVVAETISPAPAQTSTAV